MVRKSHPKVQVHMASLRPKSDQNSIAQNLLPFKNKIKNKSKKPKKTKLAYINKQYQSTIEGKRRMWREPFSVDWGVQMVKAEGRTQTPKKPHP